MASFHAPNEKDDVLMSRKMMAAIKIEIDRALAEDDEATAHTLQVVFSLSKIYINLSPLVCLVAYYYID